MARLVSTVGRVDRVAVYDEGKSGYTVEVKNLGKVTGLTQEEAAKEFNMFSTIIKQQTIEDRGKIRKKSKKAIQKGIER